MGKIIFLANDSGYPHARKKKKQKNKKKKNFYLYLTAYTKINFKWIIVLNATAEIKKFEENTEKNFMLYKLCINKAVIRKEMPFYNCLCLYDHKQIIPKQVVQIFMLMNSVSGHSVQRRWFVSALQYLELQLIYQKFGGWNHLKSFFV